MKKLKAQDVISFFVVLLHALVIVSLFFPFYGDDTPILSVIVSALIDKEIIKTAAYSLLYIPIIISVIFIILFKGSRKFLSSVISASIGFSFSLSAFIFPLINYEKPFENCHIGFYLLIGSQFTIIFLSSIGASLPRILFKPYINKKEDTAEISVRRRNK